MQYQDIVQTVMRLRPEWQGQAIFGAIKGARDRTGCDMITLAAVAVLVAQDHTHRSPGAIANHPALVGAPLGSGARSDGSLDPDRPSLHPDLTGPEQLCDHGMDVRLRTSDDKPRCPYCRGVTRTMRNGSDAPSLVAAHPPKPSAPRRRVSDEPPQPGDPEAWQDVAARMFGPDVAGRRAGGAMTWGGSMCWRHDTVPIVPPFDECAACLDERHTTNAWREENGLPIQPPVLAQP